MRKNRFSVIEYAGHYSVRDNESNREHVMGDGVDTVFSPDGHPLRPGTEHFRKTWEKSLNQNASETAEAYFNH